MNFFTESIQNLSTFKWQEHLNWIATAGLIIGFASFLALVYSTLALFLARRAPKDVPGDLIEILSRREKTVNQNSLRHLGPLLVAQIELKTDAKIE
jgi:hypothetical protein